MRQHHYLFLGASRSEHLRLSKACAAKFSMGLYPPGAAVSNRFINLPGEIGQSSSDSILAQTSLIG
jgi:hypothetical protein